MKLLLFFVDGLGLGADEVSNPARSFLSGLTEFPFVSDSAPAEFPEGMLLAADATGGVDGKPQSATGQASLMCGVNAPAFLGYHLTAVPNDELAVLVQEQSVMKKLSLAGLRVTASNLYTPEFFMKREEIQKKRGRNTFPVSTLTIRASGVPFRMPCDYKEGKALFTDLSNRFLRDRGYDIPLITPEEAARRMVRILDEADFVFHEYFATDTYAHKGRSEDLERALGEIDRFICTLLELTDPEETVILLVSDHGNCEDSLTADHNRNPVPVMLLSRNPVALASFRGLSALEEVKNAILALFGLPAEGDIFPAGAEWL